MDGVNHLENKSLPAKTKEYQYNWHHCVFVTKYRYKMFKNPKTVVAIRSALYDVAERYGLTINTLSFGEDFAHIHLLVNIPNTMPITYAMQLLKGYSSYVVFREIPNHRLRYPRGSFWSQYYSSGSVGPNDRKTVINYIEKQDISRMSCA